VSYTTPENTSYLGRLNLGLTCLSVLARFLKVAAKLNKIFRHIVKHNESYSVRNTVRGISAALGYCKESSPEIALKNAANAVYLAAARSESNDCSILPLAEIEARFKPCIQNSANTQARPTSSGELKTLCSDEPQRAIDHRALRAFLGVFESSLFLSFLYLVQTYFIAGIRRIFVCPTPWVSDFFYSNAVRHIFSFSSFNCCLCGSDARRSDQSTYLQSRRMNGN
jgi:hypothetical protein